MARGQRGEPVRDLQRRLGAAGFAPAGAASGVFDDATSASLAAFQTARGLHPSGACDEQTWLALVEAGWELGDRLLMLTAPMLRGDDIATLQQALNHLGFDCGRPDGIFGPAAARALDDFQRNLGLTADGICGQQTVRALRVVGRQSGSGPGVATVRETESIRGRTSLATQRIVIGQFGGMSSIARPVARALREHGATVMSTDEYEASAHAAAANRFGASVYLGFEARTGTDSVVSYFAVPTYESVGGRSLATLVSASLVDVLAPVPTLVGMRLPVLRETRMPAVLCSLGPVRDVIDAAEVLTRSVVESVEAWSRTAIEPYTDA